ncbi:hypothetical protein JL37_23395 [Achromobacter sp. RTa]|uniref:hypothetical protein n=1 Tax=Achromobacter sp. RTa TaxID=1532557 RepID=UPI00050F988F|nr:hypothetical protein [Achromobacter sp. RTa]KGD89236.1 hypothetical protein JL37_23395 [Achromobacter sp. RTa]
MSIQFFGRYGAVLCLAALVSACSSTGSGKPERQASSPSRVSAECKPSRSKCLYEGAYESGERDYAEEEAKRLNLAEVERLRRSMGR